MIYENNNIRVISVSELNSTLLATHYIQKSKGLVHFVQWTEQQLHKGLFDFKHLPNFSVWQADKRGKKTFDFPQNCSRSS
jgi:hypothetical protein